MDGDPASRYKVWEKGKGNAKGKEREVAWPPEKGKDIGGKGTGGKGKDWQEGGGKGIVRGTWKHPEQYSYQKTIRIPVFRARTGFPWKDRILGESGTNMRHIIGQTSKGVWLQLWGKGSGFRERDTGRESTEPLQLSIHGGVNVSEQDFRKAVEMCEDLLDTVCQDAREWVPPGSAGGEHGNHLNRGDRGSPGGYKGRPRSPPHKAWVRVGFPRTAVHSEDGSAAKGSLKGGPKAGWSDQGKGRWGWEDRDAAFNRPYKRGRV